MSPQSSTQAMPQTQPTIDHWWHKPLSRIGSVLMTSVSWLPCRGSCTLPFALAASCASVQMEISVSHACTSSGLTYNGDPVEQCEQVATFKYLGLHFHQSGSIAPLTTPITPMVAYLRQLFSNAVPCCDVATLSTYICIFFQARLVLHVGARSGICTALVSLLVVMLDLRCSNYTITTSVDSPPGSLGCSFT